jgi:adenylate kinase family enzyme
VVGPGGAGKSTLAYELGMRLDLPVVELDKEFCSGNLTPTPREEWRLRQRELASGSAWVMDGDLGPYDDLELRLRRADTVVVLDLPRWLCASRALRRSRERRDFWSWLWRWPNEGRPTVLAAIGRWAPDATVVVLRRPRSVRSWLDDGATPYAGVLRPFSPPLDGRSHRRPMSLQRL